MEFPTEQTNVRQLKPKAKRTTGGNHLTRIHTVGPCQHPRTEVDPTKAEVTCRDCREKLNPIWVLLELCNAEHSMWERYVSLKTEVAAMQDRVRHKCDRCGKMTRIRPTQTSAELHAIAQRVRAENDV